MIVNQTCHSKIRESHCITSTESLSDMPFKNNIVFSTENSPLQSVIRHWMFNKQFLFPSLSQNKNEWKDEVRFYLNKISQNKTN